MDKIHRESKILICGHRGMVGSAIFRQLQERGYENLLVRDRSQLNLLCQNDVSRFLKQERPDFIFVAAAKVGGILANNTYRADFIYENLMIEANIIHSAHAADVQRLLFLGSSCIYPRDCPQPIREEFLLTGALEPTNEPYAIAKIAGIKLAEAYAQQYARQYVSVMPTNLYGTNDNYDLSNSHVLPALLRKAHEAKKRGEESFTVWGSGQPRREFLHVDDLADACIFLMERDYSGPILNIGTGSDVTIRELAEIIKDTVGFNGGIIFDSEKPDGTPRKLLDVSRLSQLGWHARIGLRDGIASTYRQAPFNN